MAKRVAFLVASEGIEQVELTEPWKAVTDAGHEAVLVSPESGKVQMFNHLDKGDTGRRRDGRQTRRSRTTTRSCCPAASPTRTPCGWTTDAVGFVRDFVASGRPVAAICHAPWTLVEAGASRAAASPRGRACRPTSATPVASGSTSRSSIDGNLITSRNPDDLPDFCGAVVEALEHGAAAATAAPSA